MLNILVPLAGNNYFEDGKYIYPKPLIEVRGKTILEHVIENFNEIKETKQYIFVLNENDCKKYNFHNIVKILDENCIIIRLENLTKGALCTALLAIEYINNDTPLIIANADQIFEESILTFIEKFEKYDAGVPVFESVHPRWSYAKMNKDNELIRTTEKQPISKHAIAGFFYYKHGSDFINSAMDTIRKDAHVNGNFYISSALNEMILNNKKILGYQIDKNKYYSFYTPQKIQDFDRRNRREE